MARNTTSTPPAAEADPMAQGQAAAAPAADLVAAITRQLHADHEAREAEKQREFDRYKEWAQKDAAEKSQMVVEERYGHEAHLPRFRVCLEVAADEDPGVHFGPPPKRAPNEWPTLTVPAIDALHAAERYKEVCGIRNFLNNCIRVRAEQVAGPAADA